MLVTHQPSEKAFCHKVTVCKIQKGSGLIDCMSDQEREILARDLDNIFGKTRKAVSSFDQYASIVRLQKILAQIDFHSEATAGKGGSGC